MNTAEQIAGSFGWDGQRFNNSCGTMGEQCERHGPTVHQHHHQQTLYVFDDQSMIVINDQFWDVLTRSKTNPTHVLDGSGSIYLKLDEDGSPMWLTSCNECGDQIFGSGQCVQCNQWDETQ